jgi:hypothetical protein
MKYSWVDMRNEDLSQLSQECPEGTYIVVSPIKARKLIPTLSESHLEKADSVLIMCSGGDNGLSYYMANINRIENGTLLIDQDPLGFVAINNQPFVSGCYIQHGDWMGRTIMPPNGFRENVLSSGIGNCYPLPTMPSKTNGRIEELHESSQEKAFEALMDKITVVYP